MTLCTRGPEPEVLAREGAQIGRDYAARRREAPGYGFQWPRREGRSLLEVVREALAIMTAGLEPDAAASSEEQRRALRTIEIFDLNRAGACANRKRAVHLMKRADVALDDHAYRYLLPLCRPV